MVLSKEHAVLTRIEQSNDNKTEQVWELFRQEFRNASRQLDGELGLLLASGALKVGDIHKEIRKDKVAKLVADVATVYGTARVAVASQWHSHAS